MEARQCDDVPLVQHTLFPGVRCGFARIRHLYMLFGKDLGYRLPTDLESTVTYSRLARQPLVRHYCLETSC
jgi:hypothetical protein